MCSGRSVADIEPVPQIAKMLPWLCVLTCPDGFKEDVVLYATEWQQIENDFPEVQVLGQMIGFIDADRK